MKSVTTVLLLIVGIFRFAQGQNIFIEEEFVSASGSASELIETPTYLVNNSILSVDFVWERIEYTMPVEWSAPFCDKNNCYAPFTTTATFKLSGGEAGLLKPIFTPNEVEGMGILKVRIYSTSPGVSFDDTVTFQVTTDGFVGVSNLSAHSSISLYPTSTSSTFSISSPLPIDGYSILGREGKIILNRTNLMWQGSAVVADISSLQSGLYYVIIYNREQSLVVSKPIIKL